MKKLLCAILALCLLIPATGMAAKEVVNVFNWEDYIDRSVIEQFEQETGITVNYMCFTTNEDMLVQVEANPGAFDVIFPSEYCVERLNGKGLLAEINYDNIPNSKYLREELMNPSYDPESKHSVPYMGGTLGILYNTKMVDEADVSTWGVLWNQKYAGQVLMMSSIRDAMGIALRYQGYGMNSTDYTALRAAADLLIKQKQTGMVKAYGLDEFKDKMVAGEAALAIVYSGDAQYAINLNPDLAYSVPNEGSNVWMDCAVIPKAARNISNAEKFIDFLCRPDIAARNCEEIGYVTPNTGALELMDEEYKESYVMNPSEEVLARCEYFNDLEPAWLNVYVTLWNEVTNAKAQ